ncbi:MAG: type IV pilus biogenesis/stability protein PilW [Gammaproteobacteria bacterium]|nr:type IV pilus biogenesis/stability protein PilW [Gammaproteobacteria bacterium]
MLFKSSVLVASLTLLVAGCASVAVDPGNSKNLKASNINVQLGIGYMQQNNLEVANQKLNRALVQNPESAVAHNAFGLLQERLLEFKKAEKYYKKATELDPKNSQANNNYGTFLCRRGRQKESEFYFLQALKQPLYKTPEFALTNAAVCQIQIKEYDKATKYLHKALAVRSNFGSALVNMAEILSIQNKPTESLQYLRRYHLVKNATSKSLWLEIKNYLALDNREIANKKLEQLEKDFPDSKEFKEWKSINK